MAGLTETIDAVSNVSASAASGSTLAGGKPMPVLFSADAEPSRNQTTLWRSLGPRMQRLRSAAAPKGGMTSILGDLLKGPYGAGDTATFGSLPPRVDPAIDPKIFTRPTDMPSIDQREYDPTIIFSKPSWDI